ncbi:MAG: hypothetical protein M0R17_01580 [Candidatus Omnitrophica bacterium]|jgi:hypothetical protein|nr:hypothetical protein [Candidatus Omnitrophota bacterium]
MRKQLKNKRRSCPLCKPHKTGHSNRWKPKEIQDRKLAKLEVMQNFVTNLTDLTK